MRHLAATFLLLTTVAGCAGSGSNSQTFSVYFQPYAADLDQPALDTVHSASAFAKSHPWQPVMLVGYSAPPDPGKDVAGLSAQRAAAVQTVLVGDGVAPIRISSVANGTTDPQSLPTLAVRRVDINVGSPPAAK